MIRTFIFFDLETTGLHMPKITELSLIAVSRTALCNTTDSLPRVLHKLVLPIHPNVNINKKIHMLTGLSNENLEDAQHFNCEAYNLIVNFISRQKEPTCFVAYNGNNFDYPIILSEFKNIDKSFSENVLSIDMLNLIKDFFLPKQGEENELDIEGLTTCSPLNAEVSILLNDGYDEFLSGALDSIMNANCDYDNNSQFNTSVGIEQAVSTSNAAKTPQTGCLKNIQSINEKTPESQITKLQHSDENFQNKQRATARRKLYFTNSKPTNYRLATVCKHILGSDPENAHSAEGDCLSMIRCAIQLGNFFVKWADSNAVPLVNHTKE